MTDTQLFPWTDRLKALAIVKTVEGNIDLLPPHIRRRVVALVDPAGIAVADVSVDEVSNGPRRVSGTAAFFTESTVVTVTLDGVGWSGDDGEDEPPNVVLRRLQDVTAISAEGDSAGWAPNGWGDDPRGHYRLLFKDGTGLLFPAKPQAHTPAVHDLIARLIPDGG